MSHLRSKSAAAVVLALGLAVLAVGPASAFSAAGTATVNFAPVDPAYEVSPTRISGECPIGTVFADIELIWAGTNSGSSITPTYNAADGSYTVDASLNGALVAEGPGTTVSFLVNCFDAGSTSIAAVTDTYTMPDFAHTISAPASLLLTDALPVTVDCGTQPAVEVFFGYQDQLSAIHGQDVVPYTGAGVYTVSTPTSRGFVAGDTLRLEVLCYGPAAHTNSQRLATLAVTAPVVVPVAPAGPTLADSGVDNGGWMLAGLALLAGGGGILLVSRVRRRSA